MLINPNIDASDKELHARNGYKTASKNLLSFLQNGDQALFMKNVVRPTCFGQLSKDNLGTTKSIGGYEYKPKFKRKHNSIDHNTKLEPIMEEAADTAPAGPASGGPSRASETMNEGGERKKFRIIKIK